MKIKTTDKTSVEEDAPGIETNFGAILWRNGENNEFPVPLHYPRRKAVDSVQTFVQNEFTFDCESLDAAMDIMMVLADNLDAKYMIGVHKNPTKDGRFLITIKDTVTCVTATASIGESHGL